MKKFLHIFALILMSLNTYSQMNFFCDRSVECKDSMSRAWYPYQIVGHLKFSNEKKLIIAKNSCKPENFISSKEELYRRIASKKPSSESYILKYKKDEFETYEDYLIEYRNRKNEYDSLATAENKTANSMNMAVWVQNTTKDTILFPIQDGSLIAVLEGMNKSKQWKPVEYWWFSWCGNSYEDLILLPDNSIQIGVNNILGSTKTKMRLKIHGRDTIYVSKEFKGYVSSESFILSSETNKEMKDDDSGISFLDTARCGLTVFPDPPKYMKIEN